LYSAAGQSGVLISYHAAARWSHRHAANVKDISQSVACLDKDRTLNPHYVLPAKCLSSDRPFDASAPYSQLIMFTLCAL